MTHQAPPQPSPSGSDPGRQIAQLRQALLLVRSIAGEEAAPGSGDVLLDEAARASEAYERALPVAQRRFDALAAEAAAFTTAGVEALLAAAQAGPPRTAARRLAREIETTLVALTDLLE